MAKQKKITVADLPPALRRKLLNEDRNRATAAVANVEPNTRDVGRRANEAPTFSTPVRITFIHARKRLADPDGISVKAAIDGLVACGLLSDDSTKEIVEVRQRQVKSKIESTRIVIEEVGDA